MKVTQLVELYEATEAKIKIDEKDYKLYKNACFLSIGLAVGGIAVFNIANGSSATVSEISIVTFITGSLGALYTKMNADINKNILNSRKNTLSNLSQIMTHDDMETIERRKEDFKNLKKELVLSDIKYKKQLVKR
jgi:hypothetical protein